MKYFSAFLFIALLLIYIQSGFYNSKIEALELDLDARCADAYSEGYGDGEEHGYSWGEENGYDNGYIDGLAEGREEGYYDGLADGAEMFCNYLTEETGLEGPLEEYILTLQDYFDGEAPLSDAEEAFRELTDFCLKYDWAERCCSMGDAEFLYPADPSTEP